jgi:carboxypeptidase D
LREFILGDNPTGLVDPKTHRTHGGVDPMLAKEILPAYTRPIFYGSGTTASSTVWPEATIKAWEKFIATAA